MGREKDHHQLPCGHEKSKLLEGFIGIRITDPMDQKVGQHIANLQENDIYDDEVAMLHPSFHMLSIHLAARPSFASLDRDASSLIFPNRTFRK